MNTIHGTNGSTPGARARADEVLEGIDLSGRLALVTGGYSGIGLETVRALAGAGARVVVPARREQAARDALAGVPRTEVAGLDLADPADIGAFARAFLDTGRGIDILVANAGVMACPQTRLGADAWEAQFAINHLGHFALVQQLRPALRPGARVVSLSSSGHFMSGIRWDDVHFRSGYDRWLAYGQSKTATALFALHLDAVGRDGGLHAYAVNPGSIITPLQRHIAREEMVERGWIDQEGTPAADFKTPQQGAATSVWAATTPLLESRGGAYCQDCDVAGPADHDDMRVGGVKPWAVDPEAAARLWDLSARLTGLDAFG